MFAGELYTTFGIGQQYFEPFIIIRHTGDGLLHLGITEPFKLLIRQHPLRQIPDLDQVTLHLFDIYLARRFIFFDT